MPAGTFFGEAVGAGHPALPLFAKLDGQTAAMGIGRPRAKELLLCLRTKLSCDLRRWTDDCHRWNCRSAGAGWIDAGVPT